MSILVIGGDNLGNITEKLKQNGFKDIEHITGRKKDAKNFKIPGHIDLVMVLVDFVGHQLTKIVKEESRRSDVKIAFSKRSWIHMEKKIQECAKELTDNKKIAI
ncbi:DUF2325 domain-containing protein [Clostridium estertheticum]|uniref:Dihydroorotate dehydrogenase n=2 Tax=Clostridium estertheticum TaxID=238834 RepID=A0A1J0GC81_9CLOT|nr:DUF2325 domain-containing protein [Clostridium estertheticum]APC38956.1 dihydroorotate dehydrogenase [Clostridium estertheticum subsp. estertheticum]MBU3074763.1 DUF2325 domain-containing protein [Clostridium estertheticum]MBU3164978.1 DUF2325 domain-containing protein [Clostridium estertheticum]MBU3173913.1 DUF2325 domain-containing protein [Clostridium estertheticum]MBU3186777.1 DUF2325 domain-containing protein [Clostridium estertheticum]